MSAVPANGVTETDEYTRGYRAWILFILLLMNILNLADRQGLAAIAPAFKRDLGLTDTELGVIQGLAFAIFYTLVGLPIARLAERQSRARIIAISIAVFSAFGAMASQARSFALLLLCRIGVGIGDAGAVGPPVASLLGDHYPAGKRGAAITVVWLGAPIGALLGAVIGGWTAQHADWRLWFIGLSIPGFIVAVLAFCTLREPRAPAALMDACASASAHGIRIAMAAVTLLLLWGSLHYFLAARTVRADLDTTYQPRTR